MTEKKAAESEKVARTQGMLNSLAEEKLDFEKKFNVQSAEIEKYKTMEQEFAAVQKKLKETEEEVCLNQNHNFTHPPHPTHPSLLASVLSPLHPKIDSLLVRLSGPKITTDATLLIFFRLVSSFLISLLG